MRRDIFQAIADPTRRAILVLIAVHAMTPNAIDERDWGEHPLSVSSVVKLTSLGAVARWLGMGQAHERGRPVRSGHGGSGERKDDRRAGYKYKATEITGRGRGSVGAAAPPRSPGGA